MLKIWQKKSCQIDIYKWKISCICMQGLFHDPFGQEFRKQGLIRNICYIMSGQVIHSCRKGLFHDPYWSNRQNTSQSASQFWTFFFMHIQVNLKCTIKKAQLQRSGLVFICCPTSLPVGRQGFPAQLAGPASHPCIQKSRSKKRLLLPDKDSNQESSNSESDVLPVTPSGNMVANVILFIDLKSIYHYKNYQ